MFTCNLSDIWVCSSSQFANSQLWVPEKPLLECILFQILDPGVMVQQIMPGTVLVWEPIFILGLMESVKLFLSNLPGTYIYIYTLLCSTYNNIFLLGDPLFMLIWLHLHGSYTKPAFRIGALNSNTLLWSSWNVSIQCNVVSSVQWTWLGLALEMGCSFSNFFWVDLSVRVVGAWFFVQMVNFHCWTWTVAMSDGFFLGLNGSGWIVVKQKRRQTWPKKIPVGPMDLRGCRCVSWSSLLFYISHCDKLYFQLANLDIL